MTRWLFLFFLLLSQQLVCGQPAVSDALLRWNPYYELTWQDFRGTPGADAIGDAGAAVKITATPYRTGKEISYDVSAWFDRRKSWARDTSASLLAHERLHFDIAELYARKIRKKVEEMKESGIRDLKVFNTAIRELLDESNEADRRYDAETLHGAMARKQEVWARKVKSELDALRDFTRRKRTISAK